MRPFLKLLVCVSGLFACGCRTYDVNGEAPVRYSKEVQIVQLDSAPRAITKTIQIFETATDVQRPYHKIALLTRSGHREDEGLIFNAFAWRARQLGADGIIILPAAHGWPDYQFHAQAIIFDQRN